MVLKGDKIIFPLWDPLELLICYKKHLSVLPETVKLFLLQSVKG